MKKLNITKEHFEKSNYFNKKYGKLEYVSESGKLFKTEEGDRNGHERYITVSLPKYSAMILEMGDAKHAQHKKMRSDAPCRRTGKPSGSAD